MSNQNANVFTENNIVTELQKAPEIQGKQFIESDEVEEVARRVLDEEMLDIGPAEIGYLLVYPNINKKTAGKCKKCNKELQFYTGNNYLIQISGELWDMLTEKSRYLLVFHELLHVDAVFKSKTQEWKFKIRRHDFEDFYEIYDNHGLEWMKTIKGTVSSLYDLDPKEETEVTV